MPAGRRTLAEQLAEISKPAPVELDPEQQYSAFSHERQAEPSADDLEAGRADYVAVGKSKLRADIKNGRGEEDELEKSRRYAGRRASRKELYDDSEESDAGEEDDEVSELEGEEEDDEDEEDAASGEDEEENEEMANQDDDEAEESEDEDKDEDEAPRKKKDSSSSAALATSLRAAASADVQKGQDIKKQLLFCDGLLESRIRLHKAVAAQAKLPTPPTARPVYEQLKSKVDETMQEVEALSESLFLLRQEMMEANENVVMPDDFGTSRKRKRGVDSEQYVGATLNDLAALEHSFAPFYRSTLSKWSDKVLAASGAGAGGSSKKFKSSALAANALKQVDDALKSGAQGGSGERERLLRRTRVRRGGGATDTAAAPVDDVEVYDDGDFYAQLLRDVIENRSLGSSSLDPSTLADVRGMSARQRKNKSKAVDTRASKGRKIRYDVHEKLQNFMVPIEAAQWHAEQTDELFASLLGGARGGGKTRAAIASNGAEAASGGEEDEDEEVDAGGLRIFG